jgi:hypothetical protein
MRQYEGAHELGHTFGRFHPGFPPGQQEISRYDGGSKPPGAGGENARTGARRDTIAVSRPTPDVDVDRNQFAGAKRATIRVLRTTGFNEDVIAEDTIDLK